MSDKEIEKIEPVEFDISQSPLFSKQVPASAKKTQPLWIWVSFGVLVIVALAVIFVLPVIVSEYELPLERRVDAILPASPSQSTSPGGLNSLSPFDEAQRSAQRREAQEVLAALLITQAELDEIEVSRWGAEVYNRALEFARSGDAAYLQQNFRQARDDYQQGADLLQGLSDAVPTVLESYLIDGDSALLANEAAKALESFGIAIKIAADSERAQRGLARATTLDQVIAILDRAADASRANSLEQARDLYREALALDSDHAPARRALNETEGQILENRFAAIMSAGYAQLERGEPQRAIEEFQRAANLGINAEQAVAAITQTRNEVARVEIERLRSVAEAAEVGEQWQQAAQSYSQALGIDSNLVFAAEKMDYSEKRLRLDQLLEASIAEPLRLAETPVYQQTLDIYYTGRALENPGPRLQKQLDDLQLILENSQLPTPVRIESDTFTRVQILRIADLGSFAVSSVSLVPGSYTAVGTREGYRDVRQDFVVGFGQTPASVVVKCDERVTVTRGR